MLCVVCECVCVRDVECVCDVVSDTVCVRVLYVVNPRKRVSGCRCGCGCHFCIIVRPLNVFIVVKGIQGHLSVSSPLSLFAPCISKSTT